MMRVSQPMRGGQRPMANARQKVRRIDLTFDEFLAAVSGEMTMAELGLYWMVNLLCYSRGGRIRNDVSWLRAKFRPHASGKDLGAILKRLIDSGRVCAKGSELGVKRAEEELERTSSRIAKARENGRKGGRPRHKINEIKEPDGFNDKKLTTTTTITINNQLPETLKAPFDEFWQIYPHKIGKEGARPKFDAALKKASLEELIHGVQRYIAAKPQDRPWCNPSTWLHQQRWLDEPAPNPGGEIGRRQSTGEALFEGGARAVAAIIERDRLAADRDLGDTPPEPLLERS